MSNTVKSARGESVDFDMIRIKQQIAAAPTNVAPRESFIDSKFRRRLKQQQPLPVVDQQPTEE